MTLVLRRATAMAFVLLVGALTSGCSKNKILPQVTNLAPVVRLTASPIDTNAVCTPDAARSCYSLTLDWVGYDPDGRVDHYIYAVDPGDDPNCHGGSVTDTCWIITNENEKRLVFNAPSRSPSVRPDGRPNPDSLTILRGYHVFVIAAVDNDGKIGPRADRAFFSFTKAPTVQLENPRAIGNGERLLPPSIRISWTGRDDDGVFTTKPVRYRYLLLSPGNEDEVPGGIAEVLRTGGAAIRNTFAPEFRADLGWKEVGGDTTTVQFTNLVPGAHYLFAVMGFDEAGAFSPVFAFDKNIFRFTVGLAAATGPKFTIFNESFFFHYQGATYIPSNEVRIEVPAGQPVTFNWFADPPTGADITSYRWMLDGNVFDPHGRTDELTDLKHWSSPNLATISATVGPFSGGDHFFYVDAEDNTGFKSLATVHFFVVVPTFDRPLLVVNDTRYRPDQFSDTTLIAPQGPWPGAAEMDTFMCAVGGVPWEKYPPGTLTSQGILAGYSFDSLGTRKGIPDLGVPLATLGAYRHVIWMIDYTSALYGNGGNLPNDPSTSLRYMSSPGHLNTLGAYVRMGGDAWLVGGGGALATLISFDYGPNNGGGNSYQWTSIPPSPSARELAPGRFMFDVPKWQSAIRDRSGISLTDTPGTTINRNLGRFASNPGVYAGLPASFDKKNASTDPLPPLRLSSQFYVSSWNCEFIRDDNAIQEPVLGEANDFKIDNFNDPAPGAVVAHWPSSDPVNTVVSQVPVSSPGSSKAAGSALEIQTQGGGASDGDNVTFDFGNNPRDWSGLASIKFAIKQSAPSSSVQWAVRAIDVNNASASTLVNVSTTGAFVDLALPQSTFTTDPSSRSQPNFVRIQKVQFRLVHGDVAAQTDFDNLEVSTFPEGAVLDTLFAAQLSFGANPPVNATMTVYHGHDFARPFIFTGFAPWAFQRAQCQRLFDFVLQNMWGLTKNPSSVATFRAATFAPAHQLTTPLGRPGTGLRDARPQRGAAGGGLRKPGISRDVARGIL